MITRRALLGTVAGFAASATLRLSPARADAVDAFRPAPAVSQALRVAIGAYRTADLSTGDAAAGAISEPMARLVAEWVALRANGDKAGFDRISAFLTANRDWPTVALIRRKGEEALYKEKRNDADVLNFFAIRPPMSPTGRFLHALALKSEGRVKEAADIIRKSWREDSYPTEVEAELLDRFDEALTPSDHRERVDTLIGQENWAAAQRAAEKAQGALLVLAKIRIAVGKREPDAEKLLKNAPASLKNDAGFILSEAQFLRRADRLDEAYAALQRYPKDTAPPRPDDWWTERRVLARRLADAQKLDLVLDLLKPRPGMTQAALADAAFMAGLFALDLAGDAIKAEALFKESEQKASIEAGRVRAAYWIARARKAQNLDGQDALLRAERAPLSYYGQLAKLQLNRASLTFRSTPEPDFDRAAGDPLFQAVVLLLDADGGDYAAALAADLAQRLPDAPTLAALCAVGHAYKDQRLVALVGKIAIQRGFGFDLENWPVDDFPLAPDAPLERALVYAIARQESVFDPNAVSPAGARGLMQLMLPTAQDVAKKIGAPFVAERLTRDPAYNVKLGSTLLAELVDDWGGSYCLAIASYNAGKGNVRKWIAANGDPREKSMDPVRWIEKIPVTETRIYVQRVMENLQIYRARLEGQTVTNLMDDLRRGTSL